MTNRLTRYIVHHLALSVSFHQLYFQFYPLKRIPTIIHTIYWFTITDPQLVETFASQNRHRNRMQIFMHTILLAMITPWSNTILQITLFSFWGHLRLVFEMNVTLNFYTLPNFAHERLQYSLSVRRWTRSKQ
jgi:hypothetical protein